MKKSREKEERWKKEIREEVERKRGRDLPLLLLRAHEHVRESEGERRGKRTERRGREKYREKEKTPLATEIISVTGEGERK